MRRRVLRGRAGAALARILTPSLLAPALLAGTVALATVVPTPAQLAERASIVVLARVAAVEAAAGEGGGLRVTLAPERFLAGEFNPRPVEVLFSIRDIDLRRGEGRTPDFRALAESRAERVFFLRHRPDSPYRVESFHLELVDPVYGVMEPSDALLRALETAAARP